MMVSSARSFILLAAIIAPFTNGWNLTISYDSRPSVTFIGDGNSGCQNLTVRDAPVNRFSLWDVDPYRAVLYYDAGCRDIAVAGSLGDESVPNLYLRSFIVYRASS